MDSVTETQKQTSICGRINLEWVVKLKYKVSRYLQCNPVYHSTYALKKKIIILKKTLIC